MKVIYIGNASYTGSILIKTRIWNNYTIMVNEWTIKEPSDIQKILDEKMETYWVNFYWEDLPKYSLDKEVQLNTQQNVTDLPIWEIPDSLPVADPIVDEYQMADQIVDDLPVKIVEEKPKATAKKKWSPKKTEEEINF